MLLMPLTMGSILRAKTTLTQLRTTVTNVNHSTAEARRLLSPTQRLREQASKRVNRDYIEPTWSNLQDCHLLQLRDENEFLEKD